SKDEILDLAFAANPVLWLIGWLTAGMTAFYMFRMYFSTFEGKFRGHDKEIQSQLLTEAGEFPSSPMNFGPGAMHKEELSHDAHHSHDPHESPITMTLPLMIFVVPSVLIGLVGTPWGNRFEQFIHAPGESLLEIQEKLAEFEFSEFAVMAGLSVAIALAGITLSAMMYYFGKIDPEAIANKIKPLYNFSKNKWYLDNLNDLLFVQGSRRLARQVMEVDFKVVDGAVNLTGLVTLITGEGLKYLENGRAQFYALIVFLAVLGLVVFSGISS
ncbi:MAG: NAD(P)H-quinone oxidoreductase subunit 5, partial [Microcoleaceae cyanobacterium]